MLLHRGEAHDQLARQRPDTPVQPCVPAVFCLHRPRVVLEHEAIEHILAAHDGRNIGLQGANNAPQDLSVPVVEREVHVLGRANDAVALPELGLDVLVKPDVEDALEAVLDVRKVEVDPFVQVAVLDDDAGVVVLEGIIGYVGCFGLCCLLGLACVELGVAPGESGENGKGCHLLVTLVWKMGDTTIILSSDNDGYQSQVEYQIKSIYIVTGFNGLLLLQNMDKRLSPSFLGSMLHPSGTKTNRKR